MLITSVVFLKMVWQFRQTNNEFQKRFFDSFLWKTASVPFSSVSMVCNKIIDVSNPKKETKKVDLDEKQIEELQNDIKCKLQQYLPTKIYNILDPPK